MKTVAVWIKLHNTVGSCLYSDFFFFTLKAPLPQTPRAVHMLVLQFQLLPATPLSLFSPATVLAAATPQSSAMMPPFFLGLLPPLSQSPPLHMRHLSLVVHSHSKLDK